MNVSQQLSDLLDRGVKFAAIKNSKIQNPVFGFLTEVRAFLNEDCEDEEKRATSTYVGRIVFQQGITQRRPPWNTGTNTWEVFGIEQDWDDESLVNLRLIHADREDLSSYSYEDRRTLCYGVPLAKYSGATCFLVALAQDEAAVVLPNGRKLPPTYKAIRLELIPVYPESQKEAERLWESVPFNNGGGPEAERNECPEDLFQREIVSYWALRNPGRYRALLKQNTSLSEMAKKVEAELAAE